MDSEQAPFSPLDSLVGREPSWLVRAGIGLVAFLVFALLLLAAVIPYPRTLTAPLVITTAQPPLTVVAPRAGTVARWAVVPGETVQAGQLLMILDSAADQDALLGLAEEAKAWGGSTTSQDEWLRRLDSYSHRSLGPARAPYDEWLSALHEHHLAQRGHFADDRLALLRKQQEDARKRQLRRRQQVDALERTLALEREQLTQVRALHERQLIASIDLNRAEQRLLERQLQRDDVALRLEAGHSELQRYEHDYLALQERYALEHQQLASRLEGGRERLLATIAAWRRGHLLQAPIGGEVVVRGTPYAHQFVQAGEPVLRIVPRTGELQGHARLAQLGAGEVTAGQEVLIELDSYPAHEHGVINGRILRVAPVAVDSHYQLDIALPQGLLTHQGERLPVTAELEGRARIRLSDRSLLSTLFSGLVAIFTQAA